MSRWEPNARGRLLEAAMELYRERGFDATTVAEIAARAGLTERTFFRHFADKREVLFWGAAALEAQLVQEIMRVGDLAVPIDIVGTALEAIAPTFEDRRAFARQRHALITAHADLLERELNKMAALGSAMAGALRERGLEEPAASLTAEMGIAIFRLGFERWVGDAKERTLRAHLAEVLQATKTVTGAVARRERTKARAAKASSSTRRRTR
jgi:AcrR family transcriptional regulator